MADEPSAIPQDSPMGRLIEAAKRNEEAATHHLAAVGDAATRWAGFELSIDIAAINLAELKYPIALCLTAQVIGPARKLDAYISVARWRGIGASLIKELNKFHADTMTLAEHRNRAVHDPWSILDEKAKRLEVTARRRLRYEFVPVSLEEMKTLINEIDLHRDRFTKLDDRIWDALRA